MRFTVGNLIVMISWTFIVGNRNKTARISRLFCNRSTRSSAWCAKGHLRPLNLAAATIAHPHDTAMGNVKMVTAISSSTASSLFGTSSTTSTSSSSSTADDAAKIQVEIAAKKAEIASTKDPDEAATLQKELNTLETKLAKLQKSSSSQSSAAGQTTKASTTSGSSSSQSNAQSPLSGESDRIGTTNFNENTDFGNRAAYV